MKLSVLEREQLVPRPRDEVFRFFSDAANLERITPPFLRFRVTTPPPIDVREGALIDYRLSLFGVPFSWRTRIELFVPNDRFVDTQLRGPYRVWRHLHEFHDAEGGASTRMLDRVEYAVPLGPLGDAARALFVRRTLDRIFDYRASTIAQIFRAAEAA
jgi:ligand-binding SRPBCC domain-containing protein